ncbi:MAG: metal ABC transporter substrate-binding protein, partial [Phycisphaerae bacterium]|nr:metal ABC transporter substrate-binding protein [Phycisphaerae bacterium]
CGRKGESKSGLRVLCSTFPMYVFTRNVTDGRGDVQVGLMLPAAAGCPHDYALTPRDMQKIAAADVFIANGLGLEEYLGEPLRRANAKIKVIDTSGGVRGIATMADEDGYGRGAAANPHLFASPRRAARIVRNIAAELGKIDPAGAELYRRNAEAYAARLETLADDFVRVAKGLRSTKIVTEHAVFDYLAADAGLTIVAVIEETPGQEPSAAGMIRLVKTIRSSGAKAVLIEPQYPANVGQTIAKEAGIPVAVLDPVASGPDDAGLDYYEKAMRSNIEALKSVLGFTTH